MTMVTDLHDVEAKYSLVPGYFKNVTDMRRHVLHSTSSPAQHHPNTEAFRNIRNIDERLYNGHHVYVDEGSKVRACQKWPGGHGGAEETKKRMRDRQHEFV